MTPGVVAVDPEVIPLGSTVIIDGQAYLAADSMDEDEIRRDIRRTSDAARNHHVNTAEMDIIKATDTMCVNNPESNMGNAVGISPVLQLYKKGILIGLGTDAYTNDMLESIKVALCSQRHNACMPNVGWCEVTDMLFRNNAKMAERTGFPTLGVLKPGAAADVIVMDYKPFTPFSDANIDGHMLFGMTGRQCQTTMINGKILMRDRVLTEIDEEAVNAHILESSKRLWGRLNHREY